MKKTFITYILAFFFCLSFLLGTVSAYMHSTAFNVDKYMKNIEKNGYAESVLSMLYHQIDSIGDVVSLEADDIYSLLDEKSAVEHSKNYTRTYLTAVFNGKDFSDSSLTPYSISYAKDELKALVIEFYQNSESSFTDEEFEIIFTYIENQINASLKFISVAILEKTVPYGKDIVKIRGVFDALRFALGIALILLACIIYENLKNPIGKLLYRTGGIVFISSALLFIPTFLFDRYNLGSKVVISSSPLSVVFSSMLDTLVKGFETLTGIIFFVSFVLVIAGALLTVFSSNHYSSNDFSFQNELEEKESDIEIWV